MKTTAVRKAGLYGYAPFLGAVKDLHPIISTAEEAVQRMKIVDAVYKSVRTGKEVPVS